MAARTGCPPRAGCRSRSLTCPTAPRPERRRTSRPRRRPRRRQAAQAPPHTTSSRWSAGGSAEPRSATPGPSIRSRPGCCPSSSAGRRAWRSYLSGADKEYDADHPARAGDRHPRLHRRGGVRALPTDSLLPGAGHGGHRAGRLPRHLDADAAGVLREARGRRAGVRPGQARGSRGARPGRASRCTQLDLLSVDGPFVRVRLVSSAGFYVRALAHDIGLTLGTGATLDGLRRLRSGPFGLGDAVTLDVVAQSEIASRIVPLEALLTDWPAVGLTREGADWVSHGRHVGPAQCADGPAGRAGGRPGPFARARRAPGGRGRGRARRRFASGGRAGVTLTFCRGCEFRDGGAGPQ